MKKIIGVFVYLKRFIVFVVKFQSNRNIRQIRKTRLSLHHSPLLNTILLNVYYSIERTSDFVPVEII